VLPINNAPDAAQPTSTKPLPPLRIHHLMTWMAATAVLISGSIAFDRTARNGPTIKDPFVIAGLTLAAIAVAGALTFAAIGLSARRNRAAFPAAPGEWLLILLAGGAVALFAALVGIFVTFFVEEDLLYAYFVIADIALLVAWIAGNIIALRHSADTLAWRTFFVLLMLSPIAFFGTMLPIFAALASLLWSALNDMRRSQPRSWMHWSGAILTVAVGASAIAIWGH
jgi:hypothetical protein